MIQHKIANLFDEDVDIIAHQVNCQGTMGSGVAKQIRDKFWKTYSRYNEICKVYYASNLLGRALIVADKYDDGREVYIANLFAQDKYGRGKQQTDYNAFRKCLIELRGFINRNSHDIRIGMPYGIGCDRGGGDWNIVYKIIEEELGDYNIVLCELPKKDGGNTSNVY